MLKHLKLFHPVQIKSDKLIALFSIGGSSSISHKMQRYGAEKRKAIAAKAKAGGKARAEEKARAEARSPPQFVLRDATNTIPHLQMEYGSSSNYQRFTTGEFSEATLRQKAFGGLNMFRHRSNINMPINNFSDRESTRQQQLTSSDVGVGSTTADSQIGSSSPNTTLQLIPQQNRNYIAEHGQLLPTSKNVSHINPFRRAIPPPSLTLRRRVYFHIWV